MFAKAPQVFFHREKRRADPEEGLATLWRGKRITKKAHAGRGQETKWEIPDTI
jgi:hypothetical protein